MMKKIFLKYREMISYLFFGVLTTAVSMGIYFVVLAIFEHIVGMDPSETAFNAVRLLAQALQWIGGVAVAFFTNKKWVFCAQDSSARTTLRELATFSLGRVGTLGLDTILTFATVWILDGAGYEPFVFIITFSADLWSKIVSSVAVVIANYIISKYLVFKKKA